MLLRSCSFHQLSALILFVALLASAARAAEENAGTRVLFYPNSPGLAQGLKIEYTAPVTIEPKQEITGVIKVSNLTDEPVKGIDVQLETSDAFRLISSSPEAKAEDKKFSWLIPELAAKAEITLSYKGIFEKEGAYKTDLTVECVQLINRRLSHQFEVLDGSYLDLRLAAATRAWKNSQFPVTIKVRNFSRQPLNNVVIDFGYDEGLKQAGKAIPLGRTIPTLAPGESKEMVYQMTSDKPGKYMLQVVGRCKESRAVAASQGVEVGTSGLMVQGKNLFRGVAGVETGMGFSAKNTSDVKARFVKVYATLPGSFSLSRSHPTTLAEKGVLTWNIGDLAPGESKHFSVWGIPEKDGDLEMKLRATSIQGSENTLSVGLQAAKEPVLETSMESGEKAYRSGQVIPLKLVLSNKGQGEDKDIKVSCKLPAGVEVSSSADDKNAPVVDKGILRWDNKAVLAAGESVDYEVKVKTTQTGALPVVFEVSSASLLESAEISRTFTVE